MPAHDARSDTKTRSRRRKAYSKKTNAAREKARFAATSKKKIQAHVSSRGRRSQARRDSKS